MKHFWDWKHQTISIDQNLTCIRMITCVQATKCFLRVIHNTQSQSSSWVVHHIQPSWSHPPCRSGIAFPPLRDPPRFKDSNSEPEAPTTDYPWSLPTICSSILPAFITCNAPFRMAVMDSGSFIGMQPHQPAPLITIVTTNSARVERAITAVRQFRLHASILVRYKYIWSFVSKVKKVASLILRERTPHHHPQAFLLC